MAGSIGLSLQQQFDRTNGRLLSGGKLYTFSAGTTTPQLVYKDQALTLAHPNPITLDADGRVPLLYVADGSVRARLTNKAGVVQFDSDNILVVGPSSGGGGGASVDATTIFQTGDELFQKVSGTRSGWVRQNGKTIGSGTSGSSERANSDCLLLFTFLWQNYTDTYCPVLTGRGANAAADWAADKQITLPDMRGRVPAGVDDMGNSAASRLSGATFAGSAIATTVAGSGGEAAHTLVLSETPAHQHTVSIGGDPIMKFVTGSGGFTGGGGGSSAVQATVTAADSSVGGGGAHNNMQPFSLGTWWIKL